MAQAGGLGNDCRGLLRHDVAKRHGIWRKNKKKIKGGYPVNRQKRKMKMNAQELKGQLTDVTGRIWRLSGTDERGHVFEWIHPDAPEGKQVDGTQITWQEDSDVIEVYSEDRELLYWQNVTELDNRLSLACDYAQMAGGLAAMVEDKDKLPTAWACNQVVEALQLAGEREGCFTGSTDGISWWTEQNYVCEYDSGKEAFIIWHEGLYWIAGTPAGYVAALKRAEADIEKMLFNRMKQDLEK